jgi:hypothetical protein
MGILIYLTFYVSVMPMEKFVVARVGLATLGSVRVALDLGLHAVLFLSLAGV